MYIYLEFFSCKINLSLPSSSELSVSVVSVDFITLANGTSSVSSLELSVGIVLFVVWACNIIDSGLLELLALVVSNLSIFCGALNHLLVVCKASEKINNPLRMRRQLKITSPSAKILIAQKLGTTALKNLGNMNTYMCLRSVRCVYIRVKFRHIWIWIWISVHLYISCCHCCYCCWCGVSLIGLNWLSKSSSP